jgi:hypothetical protein
MTSTFGIAASCTSLCMMGVLSLMIFLMLLVVRPSINYGFLLTAFIPNYLDLSNPLVSLLTSGKLSFPFGKKQRGKMLREVLVY